MYEIKVISKEKEMIIDCKSEISAACLVADKIKLKSGEVVVVNKK